MPRFDPLPSWCLPVPVLTSEVLFLTDVVVNTRLVSAFVGGQVATQALLCHFPVSATRAWDSMINTELLVC